MRLGNKPIKRISTRCCRDGWQRVVYPRYLRTTLVRVHEYCPSSAASDYEYTVARLGIPRTSGKPCGGNGKCLEASF